MTKDEALKMALKFVEDSECGTADLEAHIKEALAQPEQQAEPVCPSCKGAVLYECVFCSSNNYPPQQDGLAQPEQEPVAYYHPRSGFYWAKPTSIFAPTVVDVPPMPLYTAPPQRPWVGLTEEDLDYLCHLAYAGDEEFALTVQARLKEKNT